MVANLYVNKTASTATTNKQENSNAQMDTTPAPEEDDDQQQQAKRKQSTEKSVKKVKRKRPLDSEVANDVDGNYYRTFSCFFFIEQRETKSIY